MGVHPQQEHVNRKIMPIFDNSPILHTNGRREYISAGVKPAIGKIGKGCLCPCSSIDWQCKQTL
jgi:hypothetical protein